MILRPLKDVDMYLQENKRTNLRIAIRKLNDTLINLDKPFHFGNRSDVQLRVKAI